MSNQALISLVSRAPIFRGLPLRVCSMLISECQRVTFVHGQRVIEEGAEGDAAYLVISGNLLRQTPSGTDLEPTLVSSGAMLGEMAMLISTRFGSTVIAQTEVTTIRFDRLTLHEMMQSDPAIAAHFVEKIRQRLTIFAEKLRVLDSHVAPEPIGGSIGH